jgi:hypothetical protein
MTITQEQMSLGNKELNITTMYGVYGGHTETNPTAQQFSANLPATGMSVKSSVELSSELYLALILRSLLGQTFRLDRVSCLHICCACADKFSEMTLQVMFGMHEREGRIRELQ